MKITKEHLHYIYADNNKSNRDKLSTLCDNFGVKSLNDERFKFIEIYSCDGGFSDDFELLDTDNPESTSRFVSSDDIDEMLRAAALEENEPELTKDDSPQGVISAISNRLHNIGCEHQDSELGEELGSMACDIWGVLPLISNESIQDKKPRTKVEYVKCEFSHAWEAVKAFEDGEKLYTKRSHKDYILIDNAPDVLRFLYDLHERIKTPITEREAFIEALQELWVIDGVDGQEQIDKIVNSGKFKIVNHDSDFLRSRIRAVAEWEMNTSNNHDWESVAESIYCAVDDLLKS